MMHVGLAVSYRLQSVSGSRASRQLIFKGTGLVLSAFRSFREALVLGDSCDGTNWRAVCCLKAAGLMQSHVTQGARASKDARVTRLSERTAEVSKYIAVGIWVVRCLGRPRHARSCTGFCGTYQKTKTLNLKWLRSL